jgi:Fic family protein
MAWNWQLLNWPHFTYDSSSISKTEKQFFQGAGGVFAILKHLDADPKRRFIIEILSAEGVSSAEIEGERLDRESLQSSIQRHFGLNAKSKKDSPSESGMSELLCSVYDSFNQPLTHEVLHKWHKLLMQSDTRITDIGKYRTHSDAMQIVSGRLDRKQVYFEAPPSIKVHQEMTTFIKWFNDSRKKESALARACIAHVYFESIHPFEDGNGRIGRALVEKALSQSLNHPTLIAISEEISKRKKDYYRELAKCNQTLEIGHWLQSFSEMIVKAQESSLILIDFLMNKFKLMSSIQGQINERQEKVLLSMFAEGPHGFTGGLSVKNYLVISKTSRATATRDLADLVAKDVLTKTGYLKNTRYHLNFSR